MKKQIAKLALLLSLALVLTHGASAQSDSAKEADFPILINFKLIQMNDAQAKRLDGKKVLQKEPAGRVLHSMETLSMTNHPTLFLVGDKWPISYFDPRAEQFQIQYVDVGNKIDVTLKPEANKKLRLELRAETSNVAAVKNHGHLSVYPETRALIQQQEYPGVSFGQTIVLGRYSGTSAQAFLATEGLDTQNDNLFYIIRLERP